MKKKLAKALFSSLLVLLMAGCTPTPLPSSSSGFDPAHHEHRYDFEHPEWFWKQLQSKDYEARVTFYCLDCPEGFEGHSKEVTAQVVKETKKEATCSRSGEYLYTATAIFENQTFTDTKIREYTDPLAHHYVEARNPEYLISAATCEDDAVYYLSCEHCHQRSDETFTVAGSKLGHDLEHFDARESTCQVHGNLEYYRCKRCQKYFLEEDGDPVGYNEIELPLFHKMTYHPGTGATCTEGGYLDYYTCEFEEGVKYYDEAGERMVESDSDLYVSALGHTFGEDGECIRCHRTLKEEYGLEDPTLLDLQTPATLSDAGISDGAVPRNDIGHLFGSYDYLSNKGINLWFKYRFTEVVSGDTQLMVYLFNQRDESGIAFRFDTNRSENDGICTGYILDRVNNVNTGVIFPILSKMKTEQDITVHIFAYLTDETTNTFTVGYQAGVDKMFNPVAYPGGDGYETDSPLFTTEVTLGAGYFDNNAHQVLRISAIRNGSISVQSRRAMEQKVVLRNESGDILGVTRIEVGSSATFTTPELYKEGYQFIGWYGTQGWKSDFFIISDAFYLTARFVELQTSMFNPSDAGYDTADNKWLIIDSNSAPEVYRSLPVSNTSTRNDIYFRLSTYAREGNDPFVVFGFPFDATDELTRAFLRINYNKDIHNLRGYFYGNHNNSMGEAGPDNYFECPDVLIDEYSLLIHLYAISTVAGELTFTVGAEIINLGNGASYRIEKQLTSTVSFSTADPSRNMFAVFRVNNAEGSQFRISDAF